VRPDFEIQLLVIFFKKLRRVIITNPTVQDSSDIIGMLHALGQFFFVEFEIGCDFGARKIRELVGRDLAGQIGLFGISDSLYFVAHDLLKLAREQIFQS
jgi:hypothetical protein